MSDKIKLDEIIKDLNIEDMPTGDMQLIAESCGLDVAIKLMREMGGMSIYIPKYPYFKLIERILSEKRIINYKKLAMLFGVTERYVLKILSQKRENDKQEKLFK